jgi:hypothetical protein
MVAESVPHTANASQCKPFCSGFLLQLSSKEKETAGALCLVFVPKVL